jgi:hypothetical protein
MAWPEDRFKRPPIVDIDPEEVIVGEVASDVVVKTDVQGPARGTTADGTVKSIEMHEVKGMGQLTSDLITHELLEQILIELRAIRRYTERDSKEMSDDHSGRNR